MILEIEVYLMSPMKNVEDIWEQKERWFLHALLTQLRAQRHRTGEEVRHGKED